MPLFRRLYDASMFPWWALLSESVLVAAVGIGFGFALFPTEASLIGVFLIAFGQAGTVELLLNRNRDDIWSKRKMPFRANSELAVGLLTMFVGVLATYVLVTLLSPADKLESLFGRQLGGFGGTAIQHLRFNDFAGILRHNLLVMLACFLFSLFYRHGGMQLVLAWNASVWGVIFAYVARTAGKDDTMGVSGYFFRTLVCILPHLILEVLGYVLIAMAGVFASRALLKYRLDSQPFHQVSVAVLRIAAMAVLFIFLAALAESQFAPAMVSLLFR